MSQHDGRPVRPSELRAAKREAAKATRDEEIFHLRLSARNYRALRGAAGARGLSGKELVLRGLQAIGVDVDLTDGQGDAES